MKKNLVLGLTALLVVLAFAACESSPPPSPSSPNERLINAAANGRLNDIISALEAGANINARTGPPSRSTPLLLACRIGQLEAAKYLVEHGADLEARGGDQWTPLLAAVHAQHYTIAKYLIDKGANVNARDENGEYSLQLAYERGDMDMYDYLIAHGARDFTPRQAAAQPAQPVQQSAPSYQPSAPAQAQAPAPQQTRPNAAQQIQEALRSPLESGTYGLAGTQAKIRLTSIAKSGLLYYTTRDGRAVTGSYSIDGNRMTIQVDGYTMAYTITSSTSFSGNGENWIRTGY